MRRHKDLGNDHYGALMLLALGATMFAVGMDYLAGTLNRLLVFGYGLSVQAAPFRWV